MGDIGASARSLVFSVACGAAAAAASGAASALDVFPDTVFGNGFEVCTNLECAQVACGGGLTTAISGTVYAPNGTLPLPNVEVYVPNATVGALVDGPNAPRCDEAPLGHPIAATLTDVNGNFTLRNVPATDNVPVVILAGKWRTQFTIQSVPQCTNSSLAASLRLPRNHTEGDIPHIAIVTGGADSLECLMRKTGVADAEFTTSSGGGRIHLFAGAGGANHFDIINGNATFADATALWSSQSALSAYDQVMIGCEGSQHAETKIAASLAAMKAYADLGGRVYLAHWENYWILANAASWQGIATWNTGLGNLTPDPITAQVSNTFPQAATLYSWLGSVGASAPAGTLSIAQPRQTAVGLDPNVGRKWIFLDTTSNGVPAVQYFSFTTPVEASSGSQKGRLLFTDMHAASGDTSMSVSGFPSGNCTTAVTALNPQSKALIYATFDLQRCVGSTKE